MAATNPQDGDLVVRSERRLNGRRAFLITPLAGSLRWETTCPTYEDAVQVAARTAQFYRSDIWFTKDGVTFDLVVSYRADT